MACFQTSSSSLPSMTGALSKRGMANGLAFSGGMTARLTLAATLFVLEAGEGVGEAEFDCEATDVHSIPSTHTSQSTCFMVDVPSVTESVLTGQMK
jgi:hypothetical protein